LEAFGTGPSAEISGCAHEAGDGTNIGVNGRRRQYGDDVPLND